MLLHQAILVLMIISPTKIIMDHELYDDAQHCEAVALEIITYNKTSNDTHPPYGVHCQCIKFDTTTTAI